MSTCSISSKSMHAFLSNLANRQADKRTRAKTFTSSFVGGKDRMIDKLQWSHNLHLGEGNYESDLLSAMGWRQQWLPVRAGAAVVQDSSNILPGPLWQLGCWYRDLPIDGRCAKQVSVAAFKQLTPLLIGRDTQTTITSTHTHTHTYTHIAHTTSILLLVW